MSAKNKEKRQEGALVMLLDRQRVQKAAVDAAMKVEEAEETARAAAAQAAPEEAQVSLSGSTAAAALSVPCLLLCTYVSSCRRLPETGVSQFLTSFSISGKVPGRGEFDGKAEGLCVCVCWGSRAVIPLEVTYDCSSQRPDFLFCCFGEVTYDCSEVSDGLRD